MNFGSPFLAPIAKAGGACPIPVIYFDDFVEGRSYTPDNQLIASAQGKFSELANMGDWLVTILDSGAGSNEVIRISDDAAGGHLTLTNGNADDDYMNLQMNGEAWKLATGKPLIFEIRLKGDDIDLFDWFVGLAITDTDVLGGVTDRLGFECADASGDIDCVTEKDSTETNTDSGKDLADDTFVTLRFETTDTSLVRFFVNGEQVAKHATNIPDNEAMTPTIQIRAAHNSSKTMTVDYILVMQDRSA